MLRMRCWPNATSRSRARCCKHFWCSAERHENERYPASAVRFLASNSMSSPLLETLDRVQALMRLGQVTEALSQLDPLLARSPDNVEAWFTLGQAQGMLERHAEAERAFRNAATLRPDMREAHFNVALSLAYQDKLRESVGSLDRKSTRLNSSHRCISYA